MKKMLGIVALCLLHIINVNSQEKSSSFTVGKTIHLHSKILNQERELNIYVPEDYKESKEKCPVVVVLDSQKYFLNAVAYQKNLRFVEETPGFIVVGVKTTDDERAKLFNTESTVFTNYLEKELLPYIDANYATLPTERILFGWQRAAAYGVELFAAKPQLFKGYFLASPTHLSRKRIEAVAQLLQRSSNLNNYLYVSLGDVEAWSLASTNSLAKVLKENPVHRLKWKYDLFDNENHYSTTLVTMNNGLKDFFKEYAPIRYYSLKTFQEDGGVLGLKELYRKRGVRYQLSRKIHSDSKRYLFLLAVKKNNYEVFKELDKAFPDFLISFSNEHMFERFAQFYIKHKALKDAINYYKKGLRKFPKSTLLINGLQKVSLATK